MATATAGEEYGCFAGSHSARACPSWLAPAAVSVCALRRGARFGVRSRWLIAVSAVIAALILPATANASPYLSRKQAATTTKRIVERNTVAQTDNSAATCYPTHRAQTTKNLHMRWRLWDCEWVTTTTAKDGSKDVCSGALRVWRTRRGTRYKVLATHDARSPAPPLRPRPPQPQPQSPQPQPQPPQPQPQPPTKPTGASPQDILSHTYNYAIGVGQAQLTPVTHTYHFSVNGRPMVQSDEGRCTVWRWIDYGIVAKDTDGREIHQIDLKRIYVFSQWVTTNGVYDDRAQDYDDVQPAQSCSAVDVGNLDNLYNCTALTPEPNRTPRRRAADPAALEPPVNFPLDEDENLGAIARRPHW